MAKLTCYGGGGSTTGANFLLELAGKRILIDCGMEQGLHAREHNHRPFAYNVTTIDYLFVTHAHIDHVGLIPKLVRAGFKGEIYSTPETKAIAEFLLMDAVKIGADDGTALFNAVDVEKSLSLWQGIGYHEPKEFPGFKIELFDAGHVLGSSLIKFTSLRGKTMLFTGDIGNSPSPLLRDAEQVRGLDYLLMESVYGDRQHEDREHREERFIEIVRAAIARGGALLIPAFSLERTQMLLATLDNLFESKQLPPVPVFLDSPLAIRLTTIYEKVKHLYNQSVEKELAGGDDVFKFRELKETARIQDSRMIAETHGPKIVIAGSGMSSAGRILGHEIHYLPDPKSTILITGFQAAGTLGRQIEEGMKEVTIDDKRVKVRAKVEKIGGFSGHADSDALVHFASASEKTLQKVFVAMGEFAAETFLAQRLRDELGLDAVAVEEGRSYDVDL